MRAAVCLLVLSAVVSAVGCSDSPFEPNDGPMAPADAFRSSNKLTVISRNLYVGTDVDAVISALRTGDPGDDGAALVQAIETLRKTNFPARAAAIAGEIEKTRPHAVGLQEVSKIDLVLPPLEVSIHQDFLATLLAELRARGLEYQVAAQIKNIEATPFPGVSLVDFDVLLVDPRRVQVRTAAGQNFTANLGEVAPGVVLKRGWVSAVVSIDGTELSVASAHLESGNVAGFDQLRALQVQELIASLDPARPAVLLGDLNDTPGSPMYQVLAGAGFSDAWLELHPRLSGNTCCHLTDLSNRFPNLIQRIDYVFTRGLGRAEGELAGKMKLLGDAPSDRIKGLGIWPSDHAGLAAEFHLPSARPGS
jgi:endonuclease/exonuclease/phosphatase family metal-dependent hydrolase